MKTYAIMREAGPAARARARAPWSPRPRRVDTVFASCERDALSEFAFDRYLATGNRQCSALRTEWRGSRSSGAWKTADASTADPRGRDWRLVVTLTNGASSHDAVFYAWKLDPSTRKERP